MKLKSLYLLCAGLLLAFSADAQRNFVPGVLLLPGGDSLSGQIDYRKWDVNPLTISFRPDETGAIKEYAPAALKGFRIHSNQETYLSIAAVLDVTRETVEALSSNTNRDTIGGSHFFRVLADGPVQLLLYTDRFHREHFAISEKGEVTQLVRKKVYINNPDSPNFGKLGTHNFYRQQLMTAMGNCVTERRLETLDYSEAALRKLLQQYAACRYPGQETIVRKMDNDMRVSLGVMGGAGLNLHHFTGDHPMALGKYGSTVSPVIGVFLDMPLSRYRQKLSWNNEVIFTTRHFKGNWSRNGNLNEVDVNMKYVQVQTMFKYTFPKGNLRPYFAGGVAGVINLRGKDQLLRSRIGGDGSKQELPALEGGRDFFLPILMSAGVRYNKLHTELRVTLPHNLALYRSLDASVTTLQLLVRYAIF